MDPITVIATVAAVIDLVTFGYKLIVCTGELQSSAQGALEENVDRDVVVRDIQFILGNLKSSDSGDGGQELEDLRKRALKIATELSVSLNNLKVASDASKREALRKALRNLWKRKDILELDNRLRGLSQEINFRLAADSNKLLNQMSVDQRTRMKAMIDEIDQQSKSLRSEMITQQAKTREETSLLRESVDVVSGQTTAIQKNLEEVAKGSQQTRDLLLQVIDAGGELRRRFQEVENLLSRPGPDQTQDIVVLLNGAFDALALYSNRKTNVDVLLQQKSNGTSSPIPITGHVYSGSVQVSGRGKHVQGDIGTAQKDSAKHSYIGNLTISDEAKVVSGNITEPGFAEKFLA